MRIPSHLSPPLRRVALVVIFAIAALLRFTNHNWDQGGWIHPDEGHLRAITWYIRTPDRAGLYFDTAHSPLNPRNSGHTYSYGTLPLFLVRYTVEWLEQGCADPPDRLAATIGARLVTGSNQPCLPTTFTFDYSAVVGRHFSALAEMGVLLLVFLIARRLYGEAVGLLAMAFQAFTAFAIQQAHFFTVDSIAGFFVVLTAYLSVRAAETAPDQKPPWISLGLAGITTGLAAACKINAGLAALLVMLAGLRWGLRRVGHASCRRAMARALPVAVPPLLLSGLLALVAFRSAQPYAFQGPGFFGVRLSPEWLQRLSEIVWEQNGALDLPPGIQWTNRAPILFPWRNMVVWGMGLPLGLAAWVGWAVVGVELLRGQREHLVLWGWTTAVFLYLATRWTMSMRYFLPLYPLLVIMAAYVLVRGCRTRSRWPRNLAAGAAVAVTIGAALWGWAAFSIYLRPHTRIAASRWIYANVLAGATVANEHWDWGLPLPIDGHAPFDDGTYSEVVLPLYDEDTPAKRDALYDQLDQADWIFLASNRLYASIPRLASRYPMAVEYYRALFAGELGFDLAAEFTSHPALGPFQFPDQENPFPLMPAAFTAQQKAIQIALPPAEESFGVYDHPTVLIFRKTSAYSREQVAQVLGKIDLGDVNHGLTPRAATASVYLRARDPRVWGALVLLGAVIWGVHACKRMLSETRGTFPW